ncbi:hypothetical protein ACFWVU_11540 [Streptomyces sp. NPDC058686]|uniref:hypothetical protein n=1 Tax=Streptomyces sp. NPDC058686 TaxID=3346599 RepID=UPI00365D51ED
MIYQGHDAGTMSRPRLLPWSNLDGNPCYLLGDGTGSSYLSRVADNVESVQLDMAEELLNHAADLLCDDGRKGDSRTTAPQLRFLAVRLTEALRDVHRIACSRGARLAVPDGDGDDDDVDDDEPSDDELQTDRRG